MASVSFLLTRLARPPGTGDKQHQRGTAKVQKFELHLTYGNVFVVFVIVSVQNGPVGVGLLVLAGPSALGDDAHSGVPHQPPPAAGLQLGLARRPGGVQLLQLLLHVEVVVVGSVRESGGETTAEFWRETRTKTHSQPDGLDGDGQRVAAVAPPLHQDLWRRLEQQRVSPLGAVRVGLDGPGAGQRPLDQDVQRDGRRLAGRLGGRAGGIRLYGRHRTLGGVAGHF